MHMAARARAAGRCGRTRARVQILGSFN